MRDGMFKVLAGGLLGVAALWLAFAPETVSRGEMQSYVETTSTEHLRLVREDLRDVYKGLTEVKERLAAVEAILRERQ